MLQFESSPSVLPARIELYHRYPFNANEVADEVLGCIDEKRDGVMGAGVKSFLFAFRSIGVVTSD